MWRGECGFGGILESNVKEDGNWYIYVAFIGVAFF